MTPPKDNASNSVALGAASPVRLEATQLDKVWAHLCRLAGRVTKPTKFGFQTLRRERETGDIEYQIFADTEPDGTQIAWVQSTRHDAEFIAACLAQAPLFDKLLKSALPVPATGPQDDGGTSRSCTCHPDDHPPVPCAEKYAYSECVAAAARRSVPATGPSLRALIDQWREEAACLSQSGAVSAHVRRAKERCADQLEAALAAGSAPSVIQKHEDEDHEDDHTRVDSQ